MRPSFRRLAISSPVPLRQPFVRPVPPQYPAPLINYPKITRIRHWNTHGETSPILDSYGKVIGYKYFAPGTRETKAEIVHEMIDESHVTRTINDKDAEKRLNGKTVVIREGHVPSASELLSRLKAIPEEVEREDRDNTKRKKDGTQFWTDKREDHLITAGHLHYLKSPISDVPDEWEVSPPYIGYVDPDTEVTTEVNVTSSEFIDLNDTSQQLDWVSRTKTPFPKVDVETIQQKYDRTIADDEKVTAAIWDTYEQHVKTIEAAEERIKEREENEVKAFVDWERGEAKGGRRGGGDGGREGSYV